MTLFRLVSPDAMVTEERGTSKRFAKNSMQASLARPSTGGAVKASFSASPIVPVMAFFLARGCTLTAKANACRRIANRNHQFRFHHRVHREPLHTRIEGDRFGSYSFFCFVLCLCDSVVDHLLALSPKIAVPTRTQVDPSSIATSKSCDIPIESSRISNRGQSACRNLITQVA